MTTPNGNGDANSVHPTKDQTVDITKGQTAVELAVAGGPADANSKTDGDSPSMTMLTWCSPERITPRQQAI